MKNISQVPIIELWGQLVVPLQGDLADDTCDQMLTSILQRIRDRAPRGLVLDVSGLWLIDSHMCAVLARLASSARLMGVQVFLCGMSSAVVLTLQSMDIDLRGIRTAPSLEFALEELGVRVEREQDDEDEASFDLVLRDQQSAINNVASS